MHFKIYHYHGFEKFYTLLKANNDTKCPVKLCTSFTCLQKNLFLGSVFAAPTSLFSWPFLPTHIGVGRLTAFLQLRLLYSKDRCV